MRSINQSSTFNKIFHLFSSFLSRCLKHLFSIAVKCCVESPLIKWPQWSLFIFICLFGFQFMHRKYICFYVNGFFFSFFLKSSTLANMSRRQLKMAIAQLKAHSQEITTMPMRSIYPFYHKFLLSFLFTSGWLCDAAWAWTSGIDHNYLASSIT